jgi:hypothetical protein
LPYSAEISRSNPGCLYFLIDQSGSMADDWGGAQHAAPASKAVELAAILNGLLRDIVLKCSKDEGVRNYFDVGVLGYGDRIRPALGGPLAGRELVPVADLADLPLRIEDRPLPGADGPSGTRTARYPVWCDPVAHGPTPMRAAFAEAGRVLGPWVQAHPRSHPPIVFHITDGESTDGDPTGEAEDLRRLETLDGPLVLFNVHIAAGRQRELTFPAQAGDLGDPYARLLFHISSDLSPLMRERLQGEGYEAGPGARGFILNAEPAALVTFLDIGTRPANLR